MSPFSECELSAPNACNEIDGIEERRSDGRGIGEPVVDLVGYVTLRASTAREIAARLRRGGPK